MDKILWGMIGTGDVTEHKSGPAFNRVEHSSLVAVMNRTPAKAADYARRHGVPRWYETADELIADPEINAVYIATPPDSHLEYTRKVAGAGKAVYVEKPMARTHAESQDMVETCRLAGVPLFVAYYRRCLPAFVKVRELVRSGAVGDVRLINVRLFHPPHPGDDDPANLPWRVIPEIAGGGYFYDLASHQMDYLDYLFGPVTATAGIAGNQAGLYPAEDIVTAAWKHESGIQGTGAWCFTAAPGQQTDLAEIVGSRGRITFSFFEQIPVRLENGNGAEEWSFPRQDPIQQPLVQTIVDELRGVGKCPSTGVSAARTNRVLEEMIRMRLE